MPTQRPGIPFRMFPDPIVVPMGRCRCGKPARLDRMTFGLGETCARAAGLIGKTTDVGQTGPDLFDNADEEDRATVETGDLRSGPKR